LLITVNCTKRHHFKKEDYIFYWMGCKLQPAWGVQAPATYPLWPLAISPSQFGGHRRVRKRKTLTVLAFYQQAGCFRFNTQIIQTTYAYPLFRTLLLSSDASFRTT